MTEYLTVRQKDVPSSYMTLIDPSHRKLLCIETLLVLVPSTETMFLFIICRGGNTSSVKDIFS